MSTFTEVIEKNTYNLNQLNIIKQSSLPKTHFLPIEQHFFAKEQSFFTKVCKKDSLSKEYPIFTFINNKFEVYGDTTTNAAVLQYVEYPAKISLNVDCNLPEYTHDEIVQLAVQKYFASLNNTQKVN